MRIPWHSILSFSTYAHAVKPPEQAPDHQKLTPLSKLPSINHPLSPASFPVKRQTQLLCASVRLLPPPLKTLKTKRKAFAELTTTPELSRHRALTHLHYIGKQTDVCMHVLSGTMWRDLSRVPKIRRKRRHQPLIIFTFWILCTTLRKKIQPAASIKTDAIL